MQMGPREVSKKLSDQAEAVCRFLLPSGKRVGSNWVAGNVYGQEGTSLQIALQGDRVGIGADFADRDSFAGDLLTLWQKVKGVDMRTALVEAKAWLGVEQAEVRQRTYRKPKRPADVKGISKAVCEYLIDKRKVSPDSIKAFKVRATEGREIVFPSLSIEGELIACKYLAIDRGPSGKKKIRAEEGCAPTFFGWQAIVAKFKDCSEVVITEGEIDAMTWTSVGYPALSLPNGASSASAAIQYDWDNLAQFETIYLCPDNDAAGKEMIKAFIDRIGKTRLRLIRLPFKDTNEALLGGWKAEEFGRAIMEAKGLLDEKILTFQNARDEIMAWRNAKGSDGRSGSEIALLGPNIRLVRGHLMMVAGEPSHGKSLVINQIALELAQDLGEPVAVTTLEVPTIEAMAQVADLSLEGNDYGDDQFDNFVEAIGHKFVFLRETGRVALASVLEFWEYAKSRYGCVHFILDNLTKLKTKADDYAQQGEDINSLSDFARDNNVLVWVLAHHHKAREGKRDVSFDDIRGSSILADCASTILQVVRNKKKEKATDPNEDDPDTTLYCTKQKVTGIEPIIKLWRVECDVVKLRRKEPKKTRDEDVSPRTEEQAELSSDYRTHNDP